MREIFMNINAIAYHTDVCQVQFGRFVEKNYYQNFLASHEITQHRFKKKISFHINIANFFFQRHTS